MHDYVTARLIQVRREEIERAVRHPRPRRRERSWSALPTAHAVRFGLARTLAVVATRRPAPNES